MSKKVTIQDAPPGVRDTTIGFIAGEFDILIFEKGYRVIQEKVLQCPCKSKRTNQQSNCKNCGGTGWLFINPNETRMVLRNMNENTTYKAWSEENLGNVNISVMNKDRLTHMDRITLIESEANFNEIRHFRKSQDDKIFAYCSYHIKKIDYVGLFVNETTKLTRLTEGIDYTFDGNRLFLTDKYLADWIDDNTYSVTVRYIHQPQFHIIDINRQVANSRKSFEGKEEFQNLPISAVGRRAHFVLDTENIAHTRLLDNSYIDKECDKVIKVVDSYSKMC
jgi:hypothetical protein